VTAAAEEDMVGTVETAAPAAMGEVAEVAAVEVEVVARAAECSRVYGVARSFADWFEVRLAR
jgi:hypothetical protein